MRVSAILGPNAKKKWLQPFCVSGVELTVAAEEHPTFQQADAILVLGGDGTVHRHLPALVEAQKPVLVVPGGSGNDFARSLGIKSLWDAVATWEKFLRDPARVPRIDLGIIAPVSRGSDGNAGQSRYFCCAGGAGFDAQVARRANSLPAWVRASGGYLLSLIPALVSF